MDKWIKASYDMDLRVATYSDGVGNLMLRSGGPLPWRLNNPGNLRPRLNKEGQPAPKKVTTHIGFAKAKNKSGDESYFLIFPDYETGEKELRNNLRRLHNDKTISQAIHAYAPPHENNSEHYVSVVEKESQLSADRVVGTLSPGEFDRLVGGIVKMEGYDGNQSQDPRKEKRVSVSNVVLSDGARPIGDHPVVIQQGGKKQEVRSSPRGELPPLVHDPKAGPIDILVQEAKGTWKKLLSINPKDQAKHYLAVLDAYIARGKTDRHPPSNVASSSDRADAQYVVQPGDTLGKIGKIFKVSAEKIKSANNLKDINRIYPGQRLIIPTSKNATVSTAVPPPAPKPSPQSTPAPTTPARSKEGKGNPLAVMVADQKRAPWMEVAVAEAKKWAGYFESQRVFLEKKKKAEKKGGATPIGVIPINYHKEVEVGIKNASLGNTAWCASFANYCLKSANYEYELSASSRFPVHSKKFVKIDSPVYGALVVYKNPKEPKKGHVAFVYSKIEKGDIAVLGGNQGDAITINGDAAVYDALLHYEKLGYFVPASYLKYAESVLAKGGDLGAPVPINKLRELLFGRSGGDTLRTE